METLVIIRWRDVTVSNGSLCDCQCGNCLFSTCPTWLPLTAEIHQPALHKSLSLHPVETNSRDPKSREKNQISNWCKLKNKIAGHKYQTK